MNVTVPPAPAPAPANVAEIEPDAIATPAVDDPGALTDVVVALLTTVEVMPPPHVLFDAALFASPP